MGLRQPARTRIHVSRSTDKAVQRREHRSLPRGCSPKRSGDRGVPQPAADHPSPTPTGAPKQAVTQVAPFPRVARDGESDGTWLLTRAVRSPLCLGLDSCSGAGQSLPPRVCGITRLPGTHPDPGVEGIREGGCDGMGRQFPHRRARSDSCPCASDGASGTGRKTEDQGMGSIRLQCPPTCPGLGMRR